MAQVRSAVSDRTLRAVVPGTRRDELATLPGVTEVELRSERVTLASRDSDAALRALLACHPDAHDIEITAVGLEEAFLALTDEPETVTHALSSWA